MRNTILGTGLALALGCCPTVLASNMVSFGNVEFNGSSGSAEILWATSQETLAGVQFGLGNAVITSAGGGLVEEYNWSIYNNESLVLGYAFGIDGFIPPQPDPAVLIVVEFEAAEGATLSLEGLIFANPEAEEIEVDATDTVILNSCPGDLDGDGQSNVNDLLAVIAAWNTKDPSGDSDGNGFVDIADLLLVIANWGPC